MTRGVFALLLSLAAATSYAQSYPTRAVRIVVPFAVGGSADVYGRVLAAKLSDAMRQPFVIENRPGGGAVVGTDAVAKSAPDGYAVLIMSNTHTVNETLIPQKPYDLLRDLGHPVHESGEQLVELGVRGRDRRSFARIFLLELPQSRDPGMRAMWRENDHHGRPAAPVHLRHLPRRRGTRMPKQVDLCPRARRASYPRAGNQ